MFGYQVPQQQMGYMAYQQTSYGPPPNTTKKIQNYQFKLNDVLGKGNFSKVYRGINQLNSMLYNNADEPVAIKVVEMSSIKTPALMDLLYSQIDIVKTLRHPNILRCSEVFTSANNCYIITELCDGDLETRIRNKGPMGEKEASKTIFQTFQGLKYLSEQSIVHRDFKIANILFNKGIAKIADFGFAKRTKQRWKDINIGSPIYMSPEGLIDNIYGPKTDIWAFGIFMYEILQGDTPLGFCQNEQQLKMHIRNPIRPASIKSHISHELKDLILRCLDVDERRRISIQQIENTPLIRRLTMQFGYAGMSIPPETLMYYQPQQQPMVHGLLPPAMQSSIPMMPNSLNMLMFDQEPYNPTRSPEAVTSANRMKALQQMATQGYLLNPNIMQPQSIGVRRPVSPSPRINPMMPVFQDPHSQIRNTTLQTIQPISQNRQQQGMSLERPISRNNLLDATRETKILHPNSSSKGSKKQSFDTDRTTKPSDSFKIINKVSILSFQQCVNLLHYCRLIYKTAIQLNKVENILTGRPREYMTNWLFDIFKEIESKIPSQVKFEGDKASIRERKLQEVINQYHKKYFNDLMTPEYQNTNIKGLQQLIRGLLQMISEALTMQDIQQRQDFIVLAHYLMYIYETNSMLERCVQNGDYSTFLKKCNIESFLSVKKENYDDTSYKGIKIKIDRIGQ